MSIVWFDVTTIWSWHRPAVGIVRTEVECAYYFLSIANENTSYRFCIFSKTDGYSEVFADDVKARLDRISSGPTPDAQDNKTSTYKAESVEARIKKIILKAISKTPQSARGKIYETLQKRRKFVSLTLESLRKAKAALIELIRPQKLLPYTTPIEFQQPIALSQHPFSLGDTYISLGLDWDQKDLTYLYQLKKSLKLKVLLFCYDVIPVKLPHLCVGDVAARFGDYFSKVAWCADKILCISECSKRDLEDLLNELGTPVPELEVVKLGCQPQENSKNASEQVKNISESPFILFVSTIERRKNHEVLYRAYTRLIDKGIKKLPKLVFVGMQGWGVNELMCDITLDPRTKELITILNHVSDSDLLHLYRTCLATAFPSLYEGWGLPVAESLALGKYCLASNAASIPEVGGDLLDYLDPWDVQAWADAIQDIIEKPSELNRRTDRIVANYRQISWEETSRAVFESALSIR